MRAKRVATSRSTTFRQHTPHRGVMLVLVVFVLVIFFGMVAFTVDVAYMQLVRTQLRVATDAAARASGEALSRSQSLELARAAAKSLAAENLVAGESLLLDNSDIVPGNVFRQPNGKWIFNQAGMPINGLQVRGRRTHDSPSGAVKLFFAPIFDVFDYETSASAVVVRLDRDICLVVDRSSSMKLAVGSMAAYMNTSDPRFSEPPGLDSRWRALEDAVDVFNSALESTEPQEYVSLVSYASDAVWCGVSNNASDIDQDLTDDLDLIHVAVQTIGDRVFNGGTEISAGIDEAVGVLTDPSSARPFAAKTMIVLTDGNQLGGRSPVDAAQDAALKGITVHTITFSDGADQTQMQAVAKAGDGKHYHASDEFALEDVFREIALTLPVLLTE